MPGAPNAILLITFIVTLSLGTDGAAALRPRAPNVIPPPDDSPCGIVDREIRAEFDAFLSSHRKCTVDEDCALAQTGCPLGCYQVAVAAGALRQAEDLSEKLLQRARKKGCACAYKCAMPDAGCRKGQCSDVQTR